MVEMENKRAHQMRYDQFAVGRDERTAAFAMVGGGDLELIGFTELQILAQYTDLNAARLVVDVGCGPGRLARYLADRLQIKLVGTDVVPQLLTVARQECNRSDWEFVEVSDFSIPIEAGSADVVSIFSVMTNIFPEHSYLLVQEAARVLRRGGRVVISYMDITTNRHRHGFRSLVETYKDRIDPLVFLDPTYLQFFAADAGLNIINFVPPDVIQAYAPENSRLLDGREISGPLNLAQMLCIMEKS